MAVFSIEIDDNDVSDVINALCAHYRYKEQLPNPAYEPPIIDPETNEEVFSSEPETIPNPESKNQFANRMTRKFLAEHTAAYRKEIAKAAALQSVNTSVNINRVD